VVDMIIYQYCWSYDSWATRKQLKY